MIRPFGGIPPRLLQRVTVYILGISLIALGVSFAVNSNLGVSTVNSLPYVISLITGQPLNRCITAVFCFCILFQALLLGRSFQPLQLTQLIFSALFGMLVDAAQQFLGEFCLPGYTGQLIMTATGIALIALGVTIYVEAALVPMPMEGLSLAIAQKSGRISFHTVKVCLDCALVLGGVLLSFLAFKRLEGIREGTVLSAVLVGPMIPLFRRPVKPLIDWLCFPKQAA